MFTVRDGWSKRGPKTKLRSPLANNIEICWVSHTDLAMPAASYRNRYRELKKTVKGKDSLVRILFKTTPMLFYELVNEIYNDN